MITFKKNGLIVDNVYILYSKIFMVGEFKCLNEEQPSSYSINNRRYEVGFILQVKYFGKFCVSYMSRYSDYKPKIEKEYQEMCVQAKHDHDKLI